MRQYAFVFLVLGLVEGMLSAAGGAVAAFHIASVLLAIGIILMLVDYRSRGRAVAP